MGVFTKAGRRRQAASSAEVVTTVAAGCGRPSSASVLDAASLSCTLLSASNGGTAVATPSDRSLPADPDSTATCSWVGNSTSKRPAA